MARILITGGAGFIGSSLAERLSESHEVTIVDNLSSGKAENIPEAVKFVQKDLKEIDLVNLLPDQDTVFHFAANPKVNSFPEDTEKDFQENLIVTKKILDFCKETQAELLFASSSVVYGEGAEIPTAENQPLNPISMYGVTKAAGERMGDLYSRSFDIDFTAVRLANIVGPRNQKGVIWDFVKKLEDNPNELEILGNGKQRKSYLYIEDAVKGIIKAWKSEGYIYNIGSRDSISVDKIAEIVSEEMNLNPDLSYTGGEKGWEGDVPEMRLDINKLSKEDWKPENNSKDSVRKTTREILN